MGRPIRILHAHPTFSLGGKEARTIQLINAFGGAAEHAILVGNPRQLSAREAIDPAVKVVFPGIGLRGLPTRARLARLARYMREFDLVLTYNMGAFNAVLARRLFGGGPLIHHEDGFNADEAAALSARRNFYRRLGLPAAFRLVVPSLTLETIARHVWRQPGERIVRIANGVDIAAPANGTARAIPGFVRRPGERIVCSVAGLRPVKNLPLLVRAFAAVPSNTRLVIFGEGPERERIAEEARLRGVADRVHLAGFVARPADYLGACDVFALTSDSEQQPIALLEAMAAGLPVVCTAVGDIEQMVSDRNRPLLARAGDERALSSALTHLLERSALRSAIGRANRVKAIAEHDSDRMIAAYARLYGEAAGAPSALFAAASLPRLQAA